MPIKLQEKDFCTHFGTCGGCLYQGLDRASELELKEKRIVELFSEFDADILPIFALPHSWGYRNKMEFSFSDYGDQRALGLSIRGEKGRVVNLQECHLVSPWFAKVVNAVRTWWEKSTYAAYFPWKDRGHLRSLTLREGMRTSEKMVILTVSGNPDFPISDSDYDHLVEHIRSTEAVDSIILRKQILKRGTPTAFEERVLYGKDSIAEILIGENEKPYRFKIRAASFFQPNPFFAELFFKQARGLIEFGAQDFLLDLYCGAGTFGILAEACFARILGIELCHDAVLDARDNVKENGICMEILEGDVGRVLDLGLKPNVVVLDPPRSGLTPRAIKKLLALKVQKILYISCKPETQKEDVKHLVAGGYRVRTILPGDQFPHTPHIENSVALEYPF